MLDSESLRVGSTGTSSKLVHKTKKTVCVLNSGPLGTVLVSLASTSLGNMKYRDSLVLVGSVLCGDGVPGSAMAGSEYKTFCKTLRRLRLSKTGPIGNSSGGSSKQCFLNTPES